MPEKLFRFFCLLLFAVIPCTGTFAADSTAVKKPSRFELAMNISTALGRFAGNNTTSLQVEEPYLFALKFTNKKHSAAARLGANFLVTNFDDIVSNGTRNTTENMSMVTAGYEWRRPLSKHFECYFAMDAKYYELSSVTKTQTNDPLGPSESTIRTIKRGGGFSPTFGFNWNITSRITLYTEGCINFNGYQSIRDYTTAAGTTTFEDRIVRNVRPVAPTSLYLLIKL